MEVEEIPSEIKETSTVSEGNKETDGTMDCFGLRVLFEEKNNATGMDKMLDQNSTSSCPFPPGFGPCKEDAHIHRELTNKENRRLTREGTEENGDTPTSFDELSETDESETLDTEAKETKDVMRVHLG
ncbi:hypothetical protein PIB30_080487, partial [Stylosanthes scabra]|nr:hypothetical protein [Stylosanthes scabra]